MIIEGEYVTITIHIGEFEKCKPTTLPFKSGVYLLLSEQELVYVGRAKDLYYRVRDHHKTKEFTDVLYLTIPEEWERRIIEYILINQFAPKLNKVAGLIKTRDFTTRLRDAI